MAIAAVAAPAGATCRICHEVAAGAEAGEEFVAPCLCSGTVQWTHSRCLDGWRATRGAQASRRCELCSFEYLLEWRRASAREALGSLLTKALMVASPLALAGIILSICLRPAVGAVVAGAILGMWAVFDVAASAISLLMCCFCRRRGSVVEQIAVMGGSLQRLLRSPEDGVDIGNDATSRHTPLNTLKISGLPNRGGDAADDDDPGGGGGGRLQQLQTKLRSMASGCRPMVFFLPAFLPQIVTWVLFALRGYLGPRGLDELAAALALGGGVYAPVALAVASLAAARRPPWVVSRTAAGLPAIRSLSPVERSALCRSG
mmetsp:Transcript_57906/g.188275  ORF Transcript_57906/g.188275 Transcript_57906/m.188275 type:complete len:317 (+) Transcript_57906:777-1727(+)